MRGLNGQDSGNLCRFTIGHELRQAYFTTSTTNGFRRSSTRFGAESWNAIVEISRYFDSHLAPVSTYFLGCSLKNFTTSGHASDGGEWPPSYRYVSTGVPVAEG